MIKWQWYKDMDMSFDWQKFGERCLDVLKAYKFFSDRLDNGFKNYLNRLESNKKP